MSTDVATLTIAVDSRPVREGTRDLDGLSGAAAKAETYVGKMAASLAALAAGAASLRILYEVNAEFQRLHTQLQTFAGLNGADAVFRDLQRFAAETPFELRELTEAWITMKARGMDPSLGTMRSVGNAASALSVSFAEMNGAIASAAAGETETLRRLGFTVRAQGDQVRIAYDGMALSVDKSARAIQAAVAQISEAKFAGGMERQVLTLGGAMSNLKDQIDATLYSIGKSGANDAMVKAIQDTGEALKDVTPRLVDFSQTAVTGAVDAVRFMHEHRDAIMALGAAYGALKVGSIVGNIATETAKWGAAKQAAIGQALIARGVTIAEAEADRLAATAKAEHAAVQLALARMQSNTAPALQQVAAQAALRSAVTASTLAIEQQIAAEAALMVAHRSAGIGAGIVSALGGPIGIVTGLLTLGATAWAVWGNSAEDAGAKATKAAQDAAKAAGSATSRLYDQVRTLEQQKRDLQARGEAGGIVGDDRFAKADADTIKRVRQLMDSKHAAEGALDAIGSGQMRFKDVNERVHAESRYATVIHQSQKGVEELAAAEAKRLSLTRDIAAMTKDAVPSDKAMKDAERESLRQVSVVQALRDEYSRLSATEAEILQGRIRAAELSPANAREAQQLAALIVLKKSQGEAEKALAEGLKETLRVMEQISEIQPQSAQSWQQFQAQREAEYARNLFNQHQDPQAKAAQDLRIIQQNSGLAPDAETYRRTLGALRSEASLTWSILQEGGVNAARTMAAAFADWATGAKLNVRDMTRSILADLARIAAQKAMTQLVNLAITSVGNVKWGGSGSGGGTYTGGIPDDWTSKSFIAPPVGGSSSSSISPTVTVNINNGPGSPQVTAEGAGQLGGVMSSVLQRAIQDECRPGGAIWEAQRRV